MKIGLVGFEFESSNKGCEALSYSFLPILMDCVGEESVEIINITIHDSLGNFPNMYPQVKFRNLNVKLKRLSCWKRLISEIKRCDVVFDITHGDSFSDIYGIKWFIHTTIIKEIVLDCGKPLVLMPQTYGPFKSALAEKWAASVIARSSKVYCRDALSCNYLKEILKRSISDQVKVYTDLAFSLPYNKTLRKPHEQKNIGINISGLLWNDCEGNKAFGLTTDYSRYCRSLIRELLSENQYEVYLVPHVICDKREGPDYFENDCRAIRILLEEFPECKYKFDFETAIDVKSFIASLDVLVAARMHASIAAYSSGVACIPFAYSRKFAGIYNGLEYPYVIDGRTLSTDEAISKTLSFITQSDELSAVASSGSQKVAEEMYKFIDDLKRYMTNLI